MQGVRAWLVTGCIMIAVMVLIGGITRLTDSGLSITEWEVVKGTLPPLTEEAWENAFAKYKQIPEYAIRHSHFTMADFKRIYFWEYFHRLWGRLMGFVFIIPFVYFWVRGKLIPILKKRGIVILLGGGAVGSLGWFMVSSGLSERPDVSHYRLAIHLSAAFSLFSYVYWTYLKTSQPRTLQIPVASKLLKRAATAGLVLLGIQIIYGAFVAGMDAGLVYNTWPSMNGAFLPENLTPFDSVWKNLTDHKDGVQFIHRNMAYLVAGITVFIALQLKKEAMYGTTWFWMLVMVTLQIVLGIITLLGGKSGDISVFWGTAHQFVALLLLIQYLNMAFKVWGHTMLTASVKS